MGGRGRRHFQWWFHFPFTFAIGNSRALTGLCVWGESESNEGPVRVRWRSDGEGSVICLSISPRPPPATRESSRARTHSTVSHHHHYLLTHVSVNRRFHGRVSWCLRRDRDAFAFHLFSPLRVMPRVLVLVVAMLEVGAPYARARRRRGAHQPPPFQHPQSLCIHHRRSRASRCASPHRRVTIALRVCV